MNKLSESLSAIRPLSMSEKSRPERAISLGFVDLKEKGHARPRSEEEYKIIGASSDELESYPFPTTRFKRLDLDLYEFFAEDLPDSGKSNEGHLKIKIDTRNPQDLEGNPAMATSVTDFKVKDGEHAPGFLHKGVFRNIIFEEWVNLSFDLFEIDTGVVEYYKKVKSVIDGVPEMRNIDILNGIPYLGLVSKLFDGIINTFGKNPDDHIWGDIPILEIEPLIGGAFLRSGIYILFEKKSQEDLLMFDDIAYKNGYVIQKNTKKEITNHLIFGIRVLSYTVLSK